MILNKTFLKKNFYIYFYNLLSIVLTYLFIIICYKQLNQENFYFFTGFIALLNILIIPLNSIPIGFSRLKEKDYLRQVNKVFFFILFLSIFLILLNLLGYEKLSFNKTFNLNKDHLYFVLIIFFSYSFYALNVSTYIRKNKFELFAFHNMLPFALRIIFVLFCVLVYEQINITFVLIIYFLSHFYLNRITIAFNKNSLKFWKNNFFLKKEFLRNFFSILIITLVLNLDILIVRTINVEISNQYYIASLYGKIIILTSVFIMPIIYKLNFASDIIFNNIFLLNFILNLTLILFYFIFFYEINSIFFSGSEIDKNLVLKICFFCLIFSCSYNLSNRLNILTTKHLLIKSLCLVIFLINIMTAANITLNLLIFNFYILSIIFLISDFVFYLKNFSIKLNLK